jgi:hypothetical protein
MKVKITLSKIIDLDEKMLALLNEVKLDRDITSLLELTDLDSDGEILIEEEKL